MTNTLSANLKRLRQQSGLTQEQAAEALKVSSQTISRWECTSSLPDASMLPAIARLYCVTIDDLYSTHARAYDNEAQRLASVYDHTHAPADFLRADMAFRRLPQDTLTGEDVRLWGVLHQHMMLYCRDRTLQLLEQGLSMEDADAETHQRIRRQYLSLLVQLGRGEECIRRLQQDVTTAARPADVHAWTDLIFLLLQTGQHQQAETYLPDALARHPDSACLHYLAGEVYAHLQQQEAAFRHWQRALELDADYLDAWYAMAEYHQQHGQYAQALRLWEQLAEVLTLRSYDAERDYPLEQAKICRTRLHA